MSEFLKELGPEFYIIFLALAVILIVIFIIIAKVFQISRAIGNRTLKVKENLILDNSEVLVEFSIINQSYIDNEISELGLYYEKRKIQIEVDSINIVARDSYKKIISIDQMRMLLNLFDYKLKKVRIYFEDSVGNIKLSKARLSRKHLKNILKAEKKVEVIEERKERIENGNLTANDRARIFFGQLASPFVMLNHVITRALNKKLSDYQMKKLVKQEKRKLTEEIRRQQEAEKRRVKKEELEAQLQLQKLRAETVAEKNDTPNEEVIIEKAVDEIEKTDDVEILVPDETTEEDGK